MKAGLVFMPDHGVNLVKKWAREDLFESVDKVHYPRDLMKLLKGIFSPNFCSLGHSKKYQKYIFAIFDVKCFPTKSSFHRRILIF